MTEKNFENYTKGTNYAKSTAGEELKTDVYKQIGPEHLKELREKYPSPWQRIMESEHFEWPQTILYTFQEGRAYQ